MSGRLPLTYRYRAATITFALVALGSSVGSMVGSLIYLGVFLRNGASPSLTYREEVLTAALFGAVLGAVLGPALAWVFMRRVPIGRAVFQTAIGALAGAGISLLVFPPFFLFGTMIGFVGAAVRLFVVSRRAVLPRGDS